MTQYTKPTVLPAWAESAGGADVLQPSNAEIQAGWPLSNVPPSRKRFNWVLKYLAQGVRYILQRGMPEWDAAEDYRINDRVMGSDGKTYKCIQAGINKDPTTQTAYWIRWGFTLAELDAEGTTPAQFDNSVKRASTAFVQRAIGSFRTETPINTSTTLDASAIGQLIVGSTGSYTTTLPLANSVPAGSCISFVGSTGISSWTVQRQGTDVLDNNGGNTSFNIGVGDSAVLESNGVGTWRIVNGSVSLKNSTLFAASKSSSGYCKLPNGLIIQWGSPIVLESVRTLTFPIAFPNACLSFVGNAYDINSGINEVVVLSGFSTTGATCFANGPAGQALDSTITYVAIGY